jgi:selenocysteine lyase/cysteine desulfurase
MEHHSNQTSWLETIADVEVIPSTEDGLFSIENLEILWKSIRQSFQDCVHYFCSNVTGIRTPYHEAAKVMHQHNGLCFVDFACSGPYVEIDMHRRY